MANRRVMMNPLAGAELHGLFKRQLAMCNLEAGECCLVISDAAFNPLYASACFAAALDLGAEAYQITLPFSRPLPQKSFGGALREADLIVYMTTHTLHYSQEMRQALENGARALMAVQPLQVLQRLNAHPDVIRRSKNGARLMQAAATIRILSDAGTDLRMERAGRPALANYGLADQPGRLDFWGAGMVQTAELEGSLEGRLVLDVGDAVFALGRYVEQPATITFRDGRAVDFEGGLDAFLVRKHLESYDDPKAFFGGHMAWGVDRRAQWSALAAAFPEPGLSAADIESYYGNVQIEIGSNNDVTFQGKNATEAHLGLCCLNCSLYLDDELILDHGRFIPEDLK